MDELNHINCKNIQINPNDPKLMKKTLLKVKNADGAIFDTFVAEEFYNIYCKNYLP